ncbi:LOW QUALITY PROTEIN: beta-glucuronosyltransferase GlcAT14B [Cucumis sativus]|uniref:LOW QUALITY PROTEIN: beta-glucuronosyltransferase GlcAT14B n=1 Tax=Cucumis sativus TaxID=3659 RepID=UPI0012F49018|nr:LOW QUALITY PROTEIN: beta-glucuronosyltransferase GlcAT14B [Cucumis sativus]
MRTKTLISASAERHLNSQLNKPTTTTSPRKRMQSSPAPPSLAPSPAALALKDSKTTLSIIFATALFSLIFFLSISSSANLSPFSSPALPRRPKNPFLFPTRQAHRTVFHSSNASSDPTPPSIAYLISGSNGDSDRILRLLFAAYHPRNHYLLHLDLSAPQSERDSLALAVESVPIFRAAQNVDVIGRADFVYLKGSSAISSTLHGASLLLHLSPNWDWFIRLTADDYPLVTQDDLLHILSFLPKDMNFVTHSSYIGWRETKKLKPIIVDPGLYLSEKTAMFYATQKRELPNAFQLFTGSSLSILSRNVVEFCILGTDNLPRTLLMYFSNTQSGHLNYFPTVLCNSHQFNKTVFNDNLLFAIYDKPPKEEPHVLGSSDFDLMIDSGAAFATRFKLNDPVLNRIDNEILNRGPGHTVPGGWCLGEAGNDTCLVWGNADVIRPGLGARRLEKRIVGLLSNGTFRSNRCVVVE